MPNITLLTEAKKYIQNPSHIINLYDLRFEWVQNDILALLGYDLDEITSLNHTDIFIFDDNTHKLTFYGCMTEDEGKTNLKVKTKDEKILNFSFSFKTLIHEKEPYLIAYDQNIDPE